MRKVYVVGVLASVVVAVLLFLLLRDQIKQEPEVMPGLTPTKPPVEQSNDQQSSISVEPLKGGHTVEELFANSKKLDKKMVKIRGQVVKVNRHIMDRHWIHIQDGTIHSGNFDLTITSQDSVDVGDVITAKGKVSVDRDFGAGYFYNVIIEDAELEIDKNN